MAHAKLARQDPRNQGEAAQDSETARQTNPADLAYRALVEASTDAIALVDRQGIIRYESPSGMRVLGYLADELIGKSALESIHPDDLPGVERLLTDLAATPGMRISAECRCRHKDGSWRWIESVGTNALDTPGVNALIINLRDKTDQKFTQDQLRASEKRFRSLVENSSDETVILSVDGLLIYESPSARPILGYPDGKLLGHAVWELVHPEDLPRIRAEFELLVENPDMHPREQFRLRHSGGSWRWVEAVATNLIGEPSIHGIVLNYHDVTDERLSQEKLIQRERDLAEAQKVAHIGNWIMDAQTGLVRWSDQLYEIFDVEPGPAENLYERFMSRIRPEDVPSVRQHIQQARTTGRPYQHEYQIILGNGETRTVASVGHAELDASGNITRLFGTTQDITERKQAEEKLIQSQQDLAEAQKVARIGSWSLDLKSNAGHWSDEMYEIFGAGSDVPIDSYAAFEKRLHPEDAAKVWQAHAQAISSGEPFHIEHRIITSAGEIRTIAEIGRPQVGPDGKVTGLFGTAQDITERKRAESSLLESEARYRALYEDSPVSLWEEDFSQAKLALDELRRDGVTDFRAYFAAHPEFVKTCLEGVRITDVNRATLQLFGAQDKSELLSAMSRFVSNGALLDFQEELINIAEGKRQFSWEGHNRTLDGRQLDVNLRWSAVPGYEETLSKVLVFIEDVTDRKLAEERSRLQLKRLLTLREIDSAITSSFDERFTLNLLVTRLASSLGVDAADVLLLNRYMNTLNYAAGYGFSMPVVAAEIQISGNYAGEVIRERRIVAEPDLQNPARPFSREAIAAREGFKSYYGVPLVAKGEVKGLLEIFHRTRLAPDAEWLDFLETFASQAAIAIDNAQLFEGLQRSNFELGLAYDSTIEGWSRALDLRDRETEGHTQRVTELTVSLARQLGFSDEDVLQVRRGALLHDIGKMGVPDAILLKAGPLSEEEWVLMKKHPTFAYELLSPIRYLKSAAIDIPYCHHEKWDGTGYPRGLKGEQIPLAARIFSVADVWDALISDRPYRPAWTRERAVQYIRSQAGIQFEPRVVEAFIKMFETDDPAAQW